MPEFRDPKLLIAHLEKIALVPMLEKIANEIKGELKNFIMRNWYNTYSPKQYLRTGMLVESIECKKAVKVGGYWQVEIWFNPDKIVSVPLTLEGYFPSHMNITNGDDSYGSESYGELLPQWIERGQHSSIHSYTGIHMVEEVTRWAEQDQYLKNRLKELMNDLGYKCV